MNAVQTFTRKKNSMNKFLFCILSALLTGCASTADRAREQAINDAAQKMEVFYEKPTRAYTVLGPIDAEGGVFGSLKDAERNATIEAAKLGADAVYIKDIRDAPISGFSMGDKPTMVKHAVGLALKWQ